MLKKITTFIFLFITGLTFLFANPEELKYFIKAYPDFTFETTYISAINDYIILVKNEKSSASFFWANGKMLPAEQLSKKDNYNPILYRYSKKIPDPQFFTLEEINLIVEYTSRNNRQNSGGIPPFFYDFIYDCATMRSAESHITSTTFLGKRINLHRKIKEPLKRVEEKINKMAETDDEVREFIDNLARTDCYNWREISDSGKKSLHSIGIAVDILPKGWGKKNLYWSWRRDIDNEKWMLLPLDRRWFPPQKVIEAFESEGFVYGGKWINWDNMHFEYTPEIILYNE